jgi:uncharacterized membrane protein YhaH (DUF805 family)
MEECVRTLKHFTTFNGRATRKEYWTFILLNTVVIYSLVLLPMFEIQMLSTMCAWCFIIYGFIIIIPLITVSVRRLHDIGKSGWWYFVNFIPYVGFIVFLVFMLQRSDVGINRYD